MFEPKCMERLQVPFRTFFFKLIRVRTKQIFAVRSRHLKTVLAGPSGPLLLPWYGCTLRVLVFVFVVVQCHSKRPPRAAAGAGVLQPNDVLQKESRQHKRWRPCTRRVLYY